MKKLKQKHKLVSNNNHVLLKYNMFDYQIFHTWKHNINIELFAIKNLTAFSKEENNNTILCKQNTEKTKLKQITPERSNGVDLEEAAQGLVSISQNEPSEYNTPQNTTKKEQIYNQKAFDSMNNMIQNDEGEDLMNAMNTENIADDDFDLDFSTDSEDNEPTYIPIITKRTLNTIDTGKKNMSYLRNNNFASENKVSEKQKQKSKKDTELKMSAAKITKQKTQNKNKYSKTKGTINKQKGVHNKDKTKINGTKKATKNKLDTIQQTVCSTNIACIVHNVNYPNLNLLTKSDPNYYALTPGEYLYGEKCKGNCGAFFSEICKKKKITIHFCIHCVNDNSDKLYAICSYCIAQKKSNKRQRRTRT